MDFHGCAPRASRLRLQKRHPQRAMVDPGIGPRCPFGARLGQGGARTVSGSRTSSGSCGTTTAWTTSATLRLSWPSRSPTFTERPRRPPRKRWATDRAGGGVWMTTASRSMPTTVRSGQKASRPDHRSCNCMSTYAQSQTLVRPRRVKGTPSGALTDSSQAAPGSSRSAADARLWRPFTVASICARPRGGTHPCGGLPVAGTRRPTTRTRSRAVLLAGAAHACTRVVDFSAVAPRCSGTRSRHSPAGRGTVRA